MGFLDLFRKKKTDIVKSVGSSITITNKILSQSKTEVSKLNNKDLKQKFWNNLSPMWKRVLGGNYRCQEMIAEYGRILNSSGSLAEDIYIYGGKYANSESYPERLFDITEIKYPYKVYTIHSMFGDSSVTFGESIKGQFITELPDFSLFNNLDELVIYEDKIKDYSNFDKMCSLSKITLVKPNGKVSDMLLSISKLKNLKKLTLGYVNIDDIHILSHLKFLNKLILAGCHSKNGSLVNPNNPDEKIITTLLPNTEIIIRRHY